MEHARQCKAAEPSSSMTKSYGIVATRDQLFLSDVDTPTELNIHPFGETCYVIIQKSSRYNSLTDTAEKCIYVCNAQYNPFSHLYASAPQAQLVLRAAGADRHARRARAARARVRRRAAAAHAGRRLRAARVAAPGAGSQREPLSTLLCVDHSLCPGAAIRRFDGRTNARIEHHSKIARTPGAPSHSPTHLQRVVYCC